MIAALALMAGLRLAGPTEADTSLGRFSLDVAPAIPGGIDAYVPVADWGIRAPAFRSLFEVDLELRAVDRRGVLDAVADEGDAGLTTVEEEVSGAIEDAIARAAGWALAATLGVALVIWLAGRDRQRPRRLAVIVAATGAIASAAAIAIAAITFDAARFSNPSFYGRGEELAQLLNFVEREGGGERYEETLEGALRTLSAYISSSQDPPRTGRSALLASDLHNNALVLPTLRRFAEMQPVLLAGDLGHEGNEAEVRLLADRLADLGEPAVAVSGNHDSEMLMRALAAAGITVLEADGRLTPDGEVRGSPIVRLPGGTSVAGFPDPLEWEGPDPASPRRVFSFGDMEDGEEAEAEARDELVEWFEALPKRPDIVMVHQNGLAQYLASTLAERGNADPLTIATGHDHQQHLDSYGDVVVVDAGTLGAGGIFGVGQEKVGLGRLHLAGAGGTLESVDFLRIEPLSGQAEADRVVVEVACPASEAREEPCHYEP